MPQSNTTICTPSIYFVVSPCHTCSHHALAESKANIQVYAKVAAPFGGIRNNGVVAREPLGLARLLLICGVFTLPDILLSTHAIHTSLELLKLHSIYINVPLPFMFIS
jgi:hypothetical protein